MRTQPAPCISQTARLLSDPKRTALLWALMDGQARPAGELATMTGVSMASSIAHLSQLVAAGLLWAQTRGEQRVFRLAAPDVGTVMDALAMTTMAGIARSGAPVCPDLVVPTAMSRARCCQDHLGGELAVGLYQRMHTAGWIACLEQRIEITPRGARKLAGLGIFVQALAQPVMCDCFDWSEQQPHLGGALGTALLQLFLQAGWVSVIQGSRALQVSAVGHGEIARIAAP